MTEPRPAMFKQIDVTRAVKGVIAAGLKVWAVQINRDGSILVHPGEAEATRAANDWD